ncbi:origin recognition complex subunit 4, partial [Podila humilis]
QQWSPVFTISSTLLSVQSLLSTPEPNDPQDAQVASQYLNDFKAFEETAKFWTECYAKPEPGDMNLNGQVYGGGSNGSGGANGKVVAEPELTAEEIEKRRKVQEMVDMGIEAGKARTALIKTKWNPGNRHEEMISEELVTLATTAIQARLSEHSPPETLVGLEEQYKKVLGLMRRTIEMGESNSCLLLGPRGTGKTMIIRKALQELERQFQISTDATTTTTNSGRGDADGGKDFMVIHLNGMVQTDDRMALKEIMRQLSREGESDMGNTNDALELLEKRVKSRFSHRHYYTFPPGTYHDYAEICQNVLLLTESDLVSTDGDQAKMMDVDGMEEQKQLYRKEFNRRVKALFEDGGFSKVVQRIFDLMKDVRGFYRLCFGPVAELCQSNPYLLPSQFYESGLQQRVDNKTELLKGISLLELSLLIAIKHLVERDTVTFNFEMVYDEYKEFMDMAVVRGSSSAGSLGALSGGSGSTDNVSLRLYKKGVALKAFEHLAEAELLRPTDTVGKGPKEYRMMRVMLDASQISDVVLKHRDCPTVIARWASRR